MAYVSVYACLDTYTVEVWVDRVFVVHRYVCVCVCVCLCVFFCVIVCVGVCVCLTLCLYSLVQAQVDRAGTLCSVLAETRCAFCGCCRSAVTSSRLQCLIHGMEFCPVAKAMLV